MARTDLRKTSDELIQANKDLTVVLTEKKNAVAATESATAIKKEVDALKSNKAKLAGEIAAFEIQKTDLEKDITTADSRMSVAKSKLADYLDKWNNRDKLNSEIDALN